MKPGADGAYPQRILLAILAPVLVVGLIASVVAGSLITPPILRAIQKRIDAELDYAASMALQICDSHLNYLLELRLEDDREMDRALQKEAAGQIIDLVDRFADIHLLIADGDGRVRQVSSRDVAPGEALFLAKRAAGTTRDMTFGNAPVRAHYFYFPLWDWFVVGFIHESDYQAPLMLARRAIYGGALVVLIVTWLTLYVVASRLISGPLRRLAAATSKVSQGDYTPLPHPRRDEIGQVVASFNAMVLDLEWKNREVVKLITALRESETRYRELFDGAAEGILVVETESGRLRYANATICRMLGYGETALTSLSITDIHRRQDQQLVGADQAGALERGIPSSIAEIPCIRSDGSVIYVDIQTTPVTVDGTACDLRFYTDVTDRRAALAERRELESRLHRSEKMEAIGLLAGGVAHDLNNILSGLVSYPELILMDLPEDSPLRGPLETIESSGQRAAAIVQDLLTLARRGVAVSRVVNLNHIVGEYLQSPEHQKLRQDHPEVVFTCRLDEAVRDILGSPVHLSKTIMNLVANGAEACGGGRGRVDIITRNQSVEEPLPGYDEVGVGEYAVLTVRDNGTGIAAADQKRIFEPFYSKKVMGRSGTGLGMAVVWGTVRDHHGAIDLISAPGQGTELSIYFPVTQVLRSTEPEDRSVAALLGHGEHIMVVDDVAEQREIATGMLTRLGYRVSTVASGEEAIDYLKRRTVDLLVLDMIMDPGMDGLETYRQIRAIRPDQRVIIASGYSEDDRVLEVRRLGAADYVKKPYSMEQIGSAVKTVLSGDTTAAVP